jgi:single-strand DNA-binding protein
MPALNEVRLIGNVVDDLEVRYAQSGTAVGKLRLVINRTYTHGGQTKDDTAYIDITAFGKTAETLKEQARKGACLFVSGRLKTEQWNDKQTSQPRSKLAVILDSFQILGGGSVAPKVAQQPLPGVQQPSQPSNPANRDIPF